MPVFFFFPAWDNSKKAGQGFFRIPVFIWGSFIACVLFAAAVFLLRRAKPLAAFAAIARKRLKSGVGAAVLTALEQKGR